MAKKDVEVNTMQNNLDFVIDDSQMADIEQTPITYGERPSAQQESRKAVKQVNDNELINCLTNKIVVVKYIPRQGTISDPKHVMYGGLAERSTITLTVPRLKSGTLKNVLMDSEKAYLEHILGLEYGALNVYNKVNNFLENSTVGGVSSVRLSKYDTRLDLSDPIDYIKYKILLANKDIVAPDLQTLQDKPKATYQFVITSDDIVNTAAKSKMTIKMQCYVEYGKVENKPDVLRSIIESLTGKPLASNTKLEFLQTKAGELIEAEPRMFFKVIKDPLLETRVLIQQCIEAGLISKKGNYLYLRSDNTPLCEGGEEPVLSAAAKYLSNPKRQELKLTLEAKLKV